jgi:sulfonate transport system substrate-binding protein
VLATYEGARKYSLANYDDLKKTFMAVTKLPDAVVDKQLKERLIRQVWRWRTG